ncbi:MAG: 2-oxo acid dehydrogenase subunit E2 [Verrucomicrobiae bacterium]|nr:2-oxo acid dehydrogenase subunit E2 [Verrucomicrobiae bacterium]
MDVKLPQLGEGVDSAVVVGVLVKEGDTVAKDQPLLELESEKAIATLPSPGAGVVTKLHVKQGDKVTVGQILVTLGHAAGAGAPAPQPAPAAPAAALAAPELEDAAVAAPEPEPQVEPESVAAVAEPAEEAVPPRVAAPVAPPSIRKLALELGIDLTRVRGTGPGGRIGMADLRAYIQRLQKAAEKPKPAPAKPAPTAPAQIDFAKWGPVSRQPLTPLRQVIARRMLENWTSIPHVTQFDEADLTVVNQLRAKYDPVYKQRGARLTPTVFLIKAVAAMLRKYPVFNSSLDEARQELVLKQYVHIGIAVDTEHGLIVPVLRDADKKTMLELALELEQLVQRTRERKVSGDELKGGTFTISNQGAIGSAHFTPIINKPEVAILGVGRGALKPVVRDGKIELRQMLPLALSYDHRVIDGGMAARFMVDLVKAIEQFEEQNLSV